MKKNRLYASEVEYVYNEYFVRGNTIRSLGGSSEELKRVKKRILLSTCNVNNRLVNSKKVIKSIKLMED